MDEYCQTSVLASLTCKWHFSFFSYVAQTLKGTIITQQVLTIHNMFHISLNTTEQSFLFFFKNDFKFCCWCCRLSWIHPWFLILQTAFTFYLHWQSPNKKILFCIFFFYMSGKQWNTSGEILFITSLKTSIANLFLTFWFALMICKTFITAELKFTANSNIVGVHHLKELSNHYLQILHRFVLEVKFTIL